MRIIEMVETSPGRWEAREVVVRRKVRWWKWLACIALAVIALTYPKAPLVLLFLAALAGSLVDPIFDPILRRDGVEHRD